MRKVATAMMVVVLFGATSAVRGADDSKELVVGTWEIVYSDAKDVPAGTKLEFTKDGTVKLTLKADGKEVTVDGGGYKIDKDFVVLTGKDGKTNDKGRICLLNKTSFVIHDEVEDKVMVLKKMKAK